jgi:hypothetical protein
MSDFGVSGESVTPVAEVPGGAAWVRSRGLCVGTSWAMAVSREQVGRLRGGEHGRERSAGRLEGYPSPKHFRSWLFQGSLYSLKAEFLISNLMRRSTGGMAISWCNGSRGAVLKPPETIRIA